MLSRILVPYDGSKYSKNALKRAMEIAHNLDSEILLLTVVNFDYISPPGMLHEFTKSERKGIQKWRKSITNDALKALETASNLCKSKGVAVKEFIGNGNVSNEILDFSNKKKITLIVIGSQGLHGLGKLRSLGSTSRRVSEHARCPVLLVR